MKTISALVFVAICLVPLAVADTTWVAGGEVSGDWTSDNSPYIIEGNISIAPNGTLTVHNQVRVFMTPHRTLTVYGLLQVLGTEQDSVVFTADTLIDPDGWGGLRFVQTQLPNRIEYAVLENAKSASSGGAVRCTNAELVMEHTLIQHCYGGFGRGIYLESGAHVELRDCAISNNEWGNGGCGGAMRLASGASAVLERCVIENNNSLDGGGLCLHDASVSLSDCELKGNLGYIWGGAIYASGTSTITANDCRFLDNASLQGGAISANEQTVLTLNRCVFTGNQSNHDQYNGVAGAIYAACSSAIITHCTFAANTGQTYGCIYSNGNIELRNSIVAQTTGAWAVYLAAVGGIVSHCDFFDNVGGNVAGTVPNFFGNVDTVNANGDPCDRLFNLFLDPLFADPDADDFTLLEESPCIDAGDPDADPDPDGTVADIGAYYFPQPQATGREDGSVESYALLQNYPNPFNAATSISFDLPHGGHVLLNVFDITGRAVANVIDDALSAGTHQISFDASGLPSGVYLYRLQSGAFSETRKLVLLK